MKKINIQFKYAFAFALTVGLLTSLQAQVPYTFSNDGSEVTDTKTGLIWQRCSAGQTWAASSSNCTGTASLYTHEQALTYAAKQSGRGWRLPSIEELSSILDSTRTSPAIDIAAFPNTPSNYYWTSSYDEYLPGFGKRIYFGDGGGLGSGPRGDASYVRLVR